MRLMTKTITSAKEQATPAAVSATKPAHTPSTGANIIIAQTVIEAMTHGVVYFSLPLKRGCNLTAVYSDGTKETAEVKPETAQALRDYYAYANADGKKCECPSGFSLVSEIQSKRAN